MFDVLHNVKISLHLTLLHNLKYIYINNFFFFVNLDI